LLLEMGSYDFPLVTCESEAFLGFWGKADRGELELLIKVTGNYFGKLHEEFVDAVARRDETGLD